MYKTGRQRYEKGGGAIFYPTEIEIEMETEAEEVLTVKSKGGRGKNKKIDKEGVAGKGVKTVKVVLRKALMCDVKSLYKLFSEYSKAGEMLPRSMSDIYTHLRDFYIAEIECETETGNENLNGNYSEKGSSGCFIHIFLFRTAPCFLKFPRHALKPLLLLNRPTAFLPFRLFSLLR